MRSVVYTARSRGREAGWLIRHVLQATLARSDRTNCASAAINTFQCPFYRSHDFSRFPGWRWKDFSASPSTLWITGRGVKRAAAPRWGGGGAKWSGIIAAPGCPERASGARQDNRAVSRLTFMYTPYTHRSRDTFHLIPSAREHRRRRTEEKRKDARPHHLFSSQGKR